jgi:hypothetical protein
MDTPKSYLRKCRYQRKPIALPNRRSRMVRQPELLGRKRCRLERFARSERFEMLGFDAEVPLN